MRIFIIQIFSMNVFELKPSYPEQKPLYFGIVLNIIPAKFPLQRSMLTLDGLEWDLRKKLKEALNNKISLTWTGAQVLIKDSAAVFDFFVKEGGNYLNYNETDGILDSLKKKKILNDNQINHYRKSIPFWCDRKEFESNLKSLNKFLSYEEVNKILGYAFYILEKDSEDPFSRQRSLYWTCKAFKFSSKKMQNEIIKTLKIFNYFSKLKEIHCYEIFKRKYAKLLKMALEKGKIEGIALHFPIKIHNQLYQRIDRKCQEYDFSMVKSLNFI